MATLLFSDVEGSTRLLERLGTERHTEVLELHRRLPRKAFARHGGYEFGAEGDAPGRLRVSRAAGRYPGTPRPLVQL
jgi:class 3 adenylate cyclase